MPKINTSAFAKMLREKMCETKPLLIGGTLILILVLAVMSHNLVKINRESRESTEKIDQILARWNNTEAEYFEDFNTTCPPGTESVGRKCIVFGNDFVNNSVAIARCQQNGGHLYEPENRLVYARVKEIAREKSLVNRLHHDNGPWIGINDLRKENDWQYTSTGEKVRFMDFFPGQPSNGGRAQHEHCIHLWQKTNEHWKWNDIHCYAELAYICEVPSI